MKEKRLKIYRIFLIVLFFLISLIPWIHHYIKRHIEFELYTMFLSLIALCVFEISLYLKMSKKVKPAFDMMESSIDFRKYKKETRYKVNKDFYYREIPFNKDIFKLFWIGFQYGLVKNRANLLNALLLKWCKEKRVTFISKGKYIINNYEGDFDNANEGSIFNLLQSKNKKGFIRLTIFNSGAIFKRIDDILLTESSLMRKEGKLIRVGEEDVITDKIKEDLDVVYGFRNFLLNFGMIYEKYPEEVMLWEEYLIYAELLGVAKRVKKEFKRLNIDYSSRELKFKKINRGLVNFLKRLLILSYAFYGAMFLMATYAIWLLFAWLTWKFI